MPWISRTIHAVGIYREYLVIKAYPAGLIFGNDWWLATACTVTRGLYGQFTEFAFPGLAAFAIFGISLVELVIVTKIRNHFSLQGSLNRYKVIYIPV